MMVKVVVEMRVVSLCGGCEKWGLGIGFWVEFDICFGMGEVFKN